MQPVLLCAPPAFKLGMTATTEQYDNLQMLGHRAKKEL